MSCCCWNFIIYYFKEVHPWKAWTIFTKSFFNTILFFRYSQPVQRVSSGTPFEQFHFFFFLIFLIFFMLSFLNQNKSLSFLVRLSQYPFWLSDSLYFDCFEWNNVVKFNVWEKLIIGWSKGLIRENFWHSCPINIQNFEMNMQLYIVFKFLAQF